MDYIFKYIISLLSKNMLKYVPDTNNNDKQQQNHVHLIIHEHLTYYHEHTMEQGYQNNHLKDFLMFSFYLVDLLEHLTENVIILL